MYSDTLVLGAGLAGLSAAYHLGDACEVYEKEAYIGGHSRTKNVDGFQFDEGPHVFFGKDACSDEFVWKPLADELLHHRAEIWNNYGGRSFGRYPVQVNAHALPPELATRCVLDFIAVHDQQPGDIRDYEQWCHAAFGRTLAEEFLLRYARKIWTVEPAEMTTDWLGTPAGGRISRPSLEQVLRGAIDPNPSTLNYLTEFAYPARGGFGRIAESLGSTLRNVHLDTAVQEINATERTIAFSDGTIRAYSAAICTLPLPTLVNLTNDAPEEVREAAGRLMWNSIRCVNLGVARPEIGPGHWVYFYDHEVPFFRVSFPSKLAPSNAPEGYSSISCEIAYSRRKPLDEHDLVGRTIDALRSTGILEADDEIVMQDQMDIPYAYVVFDFARASSVEVIHRWMRSVGLYPCGRFGEWGYHWSFEAISSGKRVAAEVAAERQHLTLR